MERLPTYQNNIFLSERPMKSDAFLHTFFQKRRSSISPLCLNNHNGYTLSFPRSFNGKEKDPESGFHYYGARYYWSELLTGWLSVDPMADKYPGISPYAYCAWNPVKLVDPDGRDGVPYVDKKRKTITVKVDIIFYMANPGHIGRRTIDQWAANLMADISKEWTSHGWTYDYNGEQYRVTFDFSYKFDNTVHGKNDFKFDGKNNRKNYIELSGKSAYRYHAKTGKNKYDHRSVVGANRTGFWYHDTKAAAHEAGHLLFLPDRYHEDDKSASGFSADPGWEGTIMAEPGGRGHVTQRDVEEVLDKLIKINGL